MTRPKKANWSGNETRYFKKRIRSGEYVSFLPEERRKQNISALVQAGAGHTVNRLLGFVE